MDASICAQEMASIEAEQTLLGAILNTQGAALDLIRHILKPADFFEPLHALLYQRFLEARDSGCSIDLKLTLISLGGDAKKPLLPDCTVSQYIARLASEAVITTSGVQTYAKLVRECAHRRALHNIGQEIIAARGVRPAELAAFAIERLDQIVTAGSEAAQLSLSISEAAERTVKHMQFALQNLGKVTGVTTGLHDLDRKTSGL